jgi:hypothetical protein
VLALSGRLVAGQDDLAVLPQRVGRDLASHEVLQLLVQAIHETEIGVNVNKTSVTYKLRIKCFFIFS